MSKAHDFHIQAEQTREAGKLLESLQLTDAAMVGYQEEGNIHGFTEVQVSRANAFKHLYEHSGDKNYLIIALHTLQGALEIALNAGKKEDLAMIYVGLGRTWEQLENFVQSAECFQKAVDFMISNPSEEHKRKGVLADFKNHLAIAQYKAGDSSAIDRAESAISELEESGEDKVSLYNYHVWLSGGHMRIAEVLKDDNKKLAEEHLQKAKEIIDSDPSLTLRKEQWGKLSKDLGLN